MTSLQPLDDFSHLPHHQRVLRPHMEAHHTLFWSGRVRLVPYWADPEVFTALMWSVIGVALLSLTTGPNSLLPNLIYLLLGLLIVGMSIAQFVTSRVLRQKSVYGLTEAGLLLKNPRQFRCFRLDTIKNVVYAPTNEQEGNLGFLYRERRFFTGRKEWVHHKIKNIQGGAELYTLLMQQLDLAAQPTVPQS